MAYEGEIGSSRKKMAPRGQTLGEEPRLVWRSRRGRKWGLRAGLPSPSRGWWDCCRWHRWRCTLGIPQSTSGSCLRAPARGWWSGRKEVNTVEGIAQTRGHCKHATWLCFKPLFLGNATHLKKVKKSVPFNNHYKANSHVAITQNLNTHTPKNP